MSDMVQSRNFGAEVVAIPSVDPVTETGSTTSSSGAGIQVTGQWIDRYAQMPPWYMSAQVNTQYKAAIAAASNQNSFTVARTIQDSALGSSSDAANLGTQPSNVTVNGTTSGSSARGMISDNVDLTYARRYIRCNLAITSGATSADTLAISQAVELGGADRVAAGAGSAAGIS